jgi:hypothetical protein
MADDESLRQTVEVVRKAVAKGYQRFVRKLEQGREMAREAGQIGRELSRVKG